MRISITGGTGFIGRRLIERLTADRHEVVVLSRRTNIDLGPSVWITGWDPHKGEVPAEALNCDAIINLAGEPIAQRWTAAAKQRIRESRVDSTRRLVEALSKRPARPAVLVSGSATGYYGNRGDETLTESSAPGLGFLPEICVEWEAQAQRAESLGMRVVRLRTGIVLGLDGGALAKMLPPFKMGAGGRLGSGRQWMSWIHLDDLAGLIVHAIQNPVGGAVNGVSPSPVTNAEFTARLAATLRRPAVFPVPAFALKVLFGEMSEVLLDSQRVQPLAAESSGYRFQYPDLAAALGQIIR